MKNRIVLLPSVITLFSLMLLSGCANAPVNTPSDEPTGGSASATFGIYSETVPQNIVWESDGQMDLWNGQHLTNDITSPGDGSVSLKLTAVSNSWIGLGMRVNPFSSLKDLSAFSNGALVFMYRSSNHVTKIGMKGGSNTGDERWIMGNDLENIYGMKSDNAWCTVVIPVPAFTNLGLSTIEEFFMFQAEGADYAIGNIWNFDNIYLTNAFALTYSVSFNNNGGSGSMSGMVMAPGTITNLTANVFTRTGYTFSGWTNSAGISYSDTDSFTMGSNSVMLYAVWTANTYTVTFDSQGGTAVSNKTVTYPATTIDTLPANPVKDDCVFAEWTNAAGATFTASTTVSSNITVYAKWTPASPGLSYTLINGNTEYSVSGGSATNGAIIIPPVHGGLNVTAVADSAFYSCVLVTDVSLPPTIVTIGQWAFMSCSLIKNITLPNSVTTINSYAFRNCTGLTNLTLSTNLKTLGYMAVYNCCNLTNLTLPLTLTNIPDSAFYNCCSLRALTIPSTITYIGDSAFYMCTNLRNLVVPVSVSNLAGNTFFYCTSLTNITLPTSITNIGTYAFYYCLSLSNLTIPSRVLAIGDYAFRSCYALTNLYVNATTPPAGTSLMLSNSSLKGIHVPSGMVTTYQNAAGWSLYSNYIVTP